MRFSGFQKLTLLDFPGRAAATAFSPGCNFRCPFCHNARLVLPDGAEESVAPEEILAYLRRRRGLLDGLCLTGGEPTLQADLAGFCREVKSLGLLVKLDTNGSRPDTVRRLIEAGLIDYVAMDVKNGRERYAETAGVPSLDLGPVEESVALLKEGRVDYEFRTTVVREFNDKNSFYGVADLISGAKKYYLQAFKDSGDLIDETLHGLTREEMEEILPIFDGKVDKIEIRGID